MRDPKKKCIAKKCDECNFFNHWNIVDDKNQEKIELKCDFEVMRHTLPKIIGSIDGVQAGSNEARNQTWGLRKDLNDFGNKITFLLNDKLKLICR